MYSDLPSDMSLVGPHRRSRCFLKKNYVLCVTGIQSQHLGFLVPVISELFKRQMLITTPRANSMGKNYSHAFYRVVMVSIAVWYSAGFGFECRFGDRLS